MYAGDTVADPRWRGTAARGDWREEGNSHRGGKEEPQINMSERTEERIPILSPTRRETHVRDNPARFCG